MSVKRSSVPAEKHLDRAKEWVRRRKDAARRLKASLEHANEFATRVEATLTGSEGSSARREARADPVKGSFD